MVCTLVHHELTPSRSQITLFIDSTPNSTLKREVEKVWKETGLKVKVIEKSGNTIKQQLCKSDPFPKIGCGESDCRICPDDKVNCKAREIVYCIECEECRNKPGLGRYVGESSLSINERWKQHLENYESKSKVRNNQSALYKHCLEEHGGRRTPFSIQILNKYPGDAMKRQISEAEYIKTLDPQLNSKDEWSNTQTTKSRKRLQSVLA